MSNLSTGRILHSCVPVDQASSSNTPTLRLRTSNQVYRTLEELIRRFKHNSYFYKSMIAVVYAVFYVNCYSPVYDRTYTCHLLRFLIFGERFHTDVPVICDCCLINHKRYGLSVHHFKSLAPYHDICLFKWNWSLFAEQRCLSHKSNCARLISGTSYCISLKVLVDFTRRILIY